MKTYNTYQEAKIENPEREIVTTSNGWAGDDYLKGKFEPLQNIKNGDISSHDLSEGGWKICNHASYCMTVDQFLKGGNKFVDGDLIIGTDCNVKVVGIDYGVGSANCNVGSDNERYILRAKVLEEPKQVEWKNGDECVLGGEIYTFGCVNPVCDQGSVVVFDETGDHRGCFIGELSKPETPEQREERERLEAAYDLYVAAQEAVDNNPIDYCDFAKNSRQMRGALAIVDKTNYRK